MSSAPTNILSVSTGLVSGSVRRIRYVHYFCGLMIDLRLLFLFYISNPFILLQIRSLWRTIAYWLARGAINSLMKSSRSFRGAGEMGILTIASTTTIHSVQGQFK